MGNTTKLTLIRIVPEKNSQIWHTHKIITLYTVTLCLECYILEIDRGPFLTFQEHIDQIA